MGRLDDGHTSSRTVRQPDDPGVLLGAVGALQPGVADAVVSLCRLGAEEVPLPGVAPEDHVEAWIVDKEDANNDLRFSLSDIAEAVRQLRAEGQTVLLHCAHARSRTPVVAATYGALVTGSSRTAVLEGVSSVLASARPPGSFVRELAALELADAEGEVLARPQLAAVTTSPVVPRSP